MKPHVEIQLVPTAPTPRAPWWADVVSDKRETPTRLHPAVDRALARHGVSAWVTRAYNSAGASAQGDERACGLDRTFRLVYARDGKVTPTLLRELAALPDVAAVRGIAAAHGPLPDRRRWRDAAPARRSRVGEAAREQIGLTEAHAVTQGSARVTVAVLDTGVDVSHPELAGRTRPGFDFVDILEGADSFVGDHVDADADPSDAVGHGTHVAGIIAARGERMPVGVAPRSRVLPVRVLGAMRQGDRRIGAGLVDNINAGIKWAVDQGADVINMSLGVRHASGGLPHSEVIEYARRRGVTVVAASGNDGTDQLYYPGALPHVIAVGAVDPEGNVPDFSTFGPHILCVAPGVEVYSAAMGGGYAFSTGTSHATPFVTGAVALLKSRALEKGVRLTDRQVKHVIRQTADKLDRRVKHPKAGYGVLNVPDALQLLDDKLSH